MINILIGILIMIIGVAILEFIARATKIPSVVIRKVIHVGMALAVVLVSLLLGYKMFIVIGLIFTVLFALSRNIYKFRCLRDRKSESWGEVYFPLGIAVSAVISADLKIFTASVLVLALSDTAAFIAGKNFTKSRKIAKNRTVIGSGAGFVVSLIILLVLGFGIWQSLLVSLGVFIIEIISQKGLDNLTMPVTAAILLSCLT